MQINILIVDDIKANLISLEALLETIDENYNIIQANNGMEALEITLNKNIDLIILDIQMPDMDGFEVATLLKNNKKTKDIPVIFLTAAFKSQEWINKGFELGAIDYLTKPIDENQFINRISLYTKLIKTIEKNREKDKILFEQSRMASMGEMIGNIAHQWRQPLSVISTASTSIQLQKEYEILSDDFLENMLNQINDSTEYLSKTIESFRELINGDKEKIHFNVAESLEKAISIEQEFLFLESIIVIKDVDTKLTVMNYPNVFLQIIVNIINNTKDVLMKIEDKDNRILFFTLYQKNSKVILEIKDSGGGIDKDILPKIFDPYFTTKHQAQGVGMGLYMTLNMIKSMNSSIEATNVEFEYNNKLYKGANFKITI